MIQKALAKRRGFFLSEPARIHSGILRRLGAVPNQPGAFSEWHSPARPILQPDPPTLPDGVSTAMIPRDVARAGADTPYAGRRAISLDALLGWQLLRRKVPK